MPSNEEKRKKLKKLLHVMADPNSAFFKAIQELETTTDEHGQMIQALAERFAVNEKDVQAIHNALVSGKLKGDSPTEEELRALIIPLIPKPVKGEKGDRGERGPKGERGERGENGAPGKTPVAGVDFPFPKDGKDGADGHIKDLDPEEIRNSLELLQNDDRLDKKAIKGIEDIEKKLASVGMSSHVLAGSGGSLVLGRPINGASANYILTSDSNKNLGQKSYTDLATSLGLGTMAYETATDYLDVAGNNAMTGTLVLASDTAKNGAGSIRYNSTNVALEYSDGTNWHDAGSPRFIYIKALTQAEGNLTLSDTNWAVDKAMIEWIRVTTTSTDWDLDIYPDANFDELGLFPSLKLVKNRNGSYMVNLHYPYIDTTSLQKVYLKFTDNAGMATADIYLLGYELR